MNIEFRWAGLWLGILGVIGATLSIILVPFLDFSTNSSMAESKVVAPARSLPQASYFPPRPEDAPESIRDAVLLGAQIVANPRKALPQNVGNDLTCNSCHFDGGITSGGRNGGLSLVGVAAQYPQYRMRQAYAVDLAQRIDDCFERSMNGRRLPENSRAKTALVSYYQWISKGVPIYAEVPWLRNPPLNSKHQPDRGAGQAIFGAKCAPCHGPDGQGSPIAGPLWGPRSFNDAAGMSQIHHFSSFTYYNMPRQAPSLTADQALDVAAYVTHQPRPAFKPEPGG